MRRAGHGGNAWEWCLTRWREDYTTPAYDDPAGDAARVVRGGSCIYNARGVRCAYRFYNNPHYLFRYFGFRVVAPPVIHDSGL